MWHAVAPRRLRLNRSLQAASLFLGLGMPLVLGALATGCGSTPSPGQVRFTVHTTPPPDDALLSPLTDARVTAIDLRDAETDAIFGHSRFDPTPAGTAPMFELPLGSIQVQPDKRDLRMLALGAAGQQVLGLALQRAMSWPYGSTAEITLELRRPLFFFGGNPQLIAPYMPMDGGSPAPYFAPNQQLYAPLRDEKKLRVIDPNSINPLLSAYDQTFDSAGGNALPVTAAAGTFDGQSLLVANLSGKLHVVDTLKLEDQNSIALNDTLPVQSVVIDPMDKTATLLLYNKPPATSGRVGRVIFIRDLPSLRSRLSDGRPLGVDIDASVVSPIGTPISAAYAPDGLIDVVVALPPVQLRQPDCSGLGGLSKSVILRYDPETGMISGQTSLPYTTAVAYTEAGDQVLVQPCTKAPDGTRVGQVVIHKRDNSAADRVLPAPGTADLAVVGNALIAMGSDDVQSAQGTTMRATVRILEANATNWATSQIDLPLWQVPYQVTLGIPHAVDVLFAPTDVLAYGIAVTPDRARALVLMRVLHQTFPGAAGLFLYSDPGNNRNCWVQWAGYTYHVMLVNLQSGAREQDYIVGVQNQSCSATFRSNSTGIDSGVSCFNPCKSTDPNPYLIGYQDGYIPSAPSVLFGRR